MSSIKRLKMGLGNWVSGPEQFFGYEDEVQRLTELIQEGENVALTAPRRAGKTSLMYEVGSRLSREEFHCLHLDLEAASNPSGFFGELERAGRELEPFQKRLVDFLAYVAAPLGELHSESFALRFSELFESDWQTRAERLFADLAALPHRSVFFVDEVPLFFHRLLLVPEGRANVESFLSLLRSAAQRHRGKLQFVVTGSVGLVPQLQRLGLSSAINHYVNFDLRPWGKDTICACVRALATNYHLSIGAPAVSRIAELLGVGIPYHVQVFFDELRQYVRQNRVSGVLPDDVDTVYRERMLGPQGTRYLSHLSERLATVFSVPAEHRFATELLQAATSTEPLNWSQIAELASREELNVGVIRRTVEVLIHDGYLIRNEDSHVSFAPGYLRDWWRGQFCVPEVVDPSC